MLTIFVFRLQNPDGSCVERFRFTIPIMDTDKDYLIAKSIVQSGQSVEEWDDLRQGKGSWPDDERKDWKQFRNYSISELKAAMIIYKNTAGIKSSPVNIFDSFDIFCFINMSLILLLRTPTPSSFLFRLYCQANLPWTMLILAIEVWEELTSAGFTHHLTYLLQICYRAL